MLELFIVMPGFVPGIHVFKAWMAGSSPAMTIEEATEPRGRQSVAPGDG
ncbi:MAG TPA: hypothetical protein VGR52_12915 [Stellaceae bacterium]|nr:hypothetical protein [Stellaceae bacterium]